MLEKMSDFFTSRVDGYDDHMLNNVNGCKDAYVKMAELLPDKTSVLLDLGCGTGLELDEIFIRHPDIKVTGIDLTKAMLDKLKNKYPDKNMTLISTSYFDTDFGIERFDTAISFQTMHHFTKEKKVGLYSRICSALKSGGRYIECDYMIMEQQEEDYFFDESKRIRKEQNVPEDEFYHYDTPCSVDNQLNMLKKAGFGKVEMVWRRENTTIITAERVVK